MLQSIFCYLLAGVSKFFSSSWTVSAEKLKHRLDLSNKSKIGFAISQPVTIEQGQLNYRVPLARTRAGSVTYQTHLVALKPVMREFDIASYYDRQLFDGEGHFRLYAEARRNLASSKNHRESRIGLQFMMAL